MILGFPALTDAYFPLTDPTIPPQNVAALFATWISGYYSHGDKAGEYEYQHYVTSPPPTATTMTDEERQSTEHPLPGDARGGSDYLIHTYAYLSGLFTTLRKDALRLPDADEWLIGDAWRDTEVRHLWCDRSVWLVRRGVDQMRAEVEEERK